MINSSSSQIKCKELKKKDLVRQYNQRNCYDKTEIKYQVSVKTLIKLLLTITINFTIFTWGGKKDGTWKRKEKNISQLSNEQTVTRILLLDK